MQEKAPGPVLILSELCGRAPYAGLRSPEDPLSLPWVPVPPSLGSRSRLSTASYFPTLHVYRADLFDPGKCLEAEAMLPFVHAYTMDSVTWRP